MPGTDERWGKRYTPNDNVRAQLNGDESAKGHAFARKFELSISLTD